MSNPNPTPQGPPTPPPGYGWPEYQGQVQQVDRDAEHLRILSICWYVLAGLAAVFGCVPFIHVTLGVLMLTHSSAFGGGRGDPPEFIGWMFVIMGSFLILLMWTGACLAFFTARALPRRRHIVLCYVAAALICLQIPIGTVLGVFTFIVLARPSVKASFT